MHTCSCKYLSEFTSRSCTLLSYEIILPFQSYQVRQLSAVELRKRVAQNSGNLWTALPQNEREQIKSKIPDIILAETK